MLSQIIIHCGRPSGETRFSLHIQMKGRSIDIIKFFFYTQFASISISIAFLPMQLPWGNAKYRKYKVRCNWEKAGTNIRRVLSVWSFFSNFPSFLLEMWWNRLIYLCAGKSYALLTRVDQVISTQVLSQYQMSRYNSAVFRVKWCSLKSSEYCSWSSPREN